MPTHIYIQIGDYDKVIIGNQQALIKDKEYIKHRGSNNFYTLYQVHNYHFLLYGAMIDGQSQLAITTARELTQSIPDDLFNKSIDWFEGFIPMVYHALIRFGKWQQILDEPLPDDPNKYCCTHSIAHYARTVALANLNRIVEAEKEKQKFYEAFARVPYSRMIFASIYRDILGVAELMLNGELEYRKGNFEKAFEYLRNAVFKEDNLPYDEPWAWMQPSRHALGALLLDQKRIDEAEQVYKADLKRYPNNLWTLQGLEECYRVKGDHSAADEIRPLLNKSKQRADIAVKSSCYCRENSL